MFNFAEQSLSSIPSLLLNSSYIDLDRLLHDISQLDDQIDPESDGYLAEQSINFRERAVTMVSGLNESFESGSPVQFKIKDPLDESSLTGFINSFFDEVNDEIRKVFVYYSKKEKELFVNLNSSLFLEQTYKTFNQDERGKFFNQLSWIIAETNQLIEICSLNFKAFHVIFNMFDAKIKFKSSKNSFVYLQKLLNRGNSNLKYLISMTVFP